tara:strand:- start:255 stop:1400 length:1146 start_codon:yes stop_codon:yes gene_type:complete
MVEVSKTKRLISGNQPRRTPPGAPPGTIVVDPNAPKTRISAIAYESDTLEERTEITLSDMRELRANKGVLWIDIDGLGDVSVLKMIGDEFGLHNLALEDVVNVHQRPKMEDYEDHLFIVCRMPCVDHFLQTEQICLFLGPDFVITFQERPGDVFEPVRNRIRTSRGRIRNSGADYLAYALMDAVTDGYYPVLENFGDHLDDLEELIMTDPLPEDVKRIHVLKRDLLTVRRAVWPLREMLNTMIRDESPLITDQIKIYLRDCADHTFQLIDLIETYREIVSDLTDIFLSAQSTRMNEVMKVLTVIATIFMPLTLISSIYGMNFDTKSSHWNMPELGWSFGYPLTMAGMFVIAIGMLLYFRKRGWVGRRIRRRRARRSAQSHR